MANTVAESEKSKLFWYCLVTENLTGVWFPPGFGEIGDERNVAVNCTLEDGVKLTGTVKCSGYGIYAVCLLCTKCGARVNGVARR